MGVALTRRTAAAEADQGIDLAAFTEELDALRREIDANVGPEDLAHLLKLERWGRLCTAAGYATGWIAPNPISAALLAIGNTARWALVMHHVGHKGYDKVPGVPARYTSKVFAQGGRRRFLDWLDWMSPDAWRYEHNILHHYRTGELEDPDLVEEYTGWLRVSKMPRLFKYLVIAFFVSHWKLTYYAPNTFQFWTRAERRRRGEVEVGPPPSWTKAFDFTTKDGRAFWRSCLLPYGLFRFLFLPLLFLPLGLWAVLSIFANSVLAELFANVYSFFLIVPNHAGDDVYRFDGRAQDRGVFYLRQVIGSVDYTSSGDVTDFLLGGLNYQIEHHLFPDLPLLKYRQYQPRVKAICEKHGIRYIEEGVFLRARKLLDIISGKSSMRRAA